MNPREPTSPLDPEERALAERLARLGPHGEPSPALDARVLAAAHAGAATSPRIRRRWPLQLGVAASIALALGLAWQLRPLPGADPARALPSPEATIDAATGDSATEMVAVPPPPASGATTAPPEPQPERVAARRAAAHADASAPPEEPPIVFDMPSPMDTAAQAARAAPAAAPMPALPAPPAPPPPAFKAATAQQAIEADAPAEEVPPATVASPEVREAWLARIRALAADGRSDEARASLQEFQRRYPDFALPDDLRPLLPADE